MSTAEPPDSRSDDAATARAAFTSAARSAVRLWAFALAAGLLWGLGGALLMRALALNAGYSQAEAWVLACAIGVALSLYPIVPALVPRSLPDAAGIALRGRDRAEVAGWVRAQAGLRARDIKVVTEPAVWMTVRGGLRIGIGLVACLREDELAALVRLARRTDGSMTFGERLALRLVYGDVGRDASFGTRRLARRLARRFSAVEQTKASWIAAEEASGVRGEAKLKSAVSARKVVAEGWDLLVDQFLWPALLVGAWHDDPWTGLRTMLAAWEQAGADVWPARRDSELGCAADELPGVMRHEPELALLILPPEWARDDEPTPWEERPDLVDERVFRRQVALTLDAARIATGRAVPATFDALGSVLEGGWAPTVAGLLGVTPTEEELRENPDGGPRVDAIISRVITEIATLSLLDASAGSLTWTWTDGSTLVDTDGRPLDVAAAVRRHRTGHATIDLLGLRAWVRRHGADPSAPVWLEEAVEPAPEATVLQFGAVRRLRLQRVVLTTDAVRFCHYKGGGAPDLHEIVPRFPLAEIVSAEVSPLIASHRHWRLKLRTADRTRSVWTSEKRADLVPALAEALGERLSLTWWALPAPLRWARNVWGFVCSALGGVSVLLGLLFIIDPLDSMRPGLVDQTVMIVGGALVYTLAYLPEWLLRLRRDRTSRRLAPVRVGPRDPH
ncbi:hypothetical protein [Nocardioides sp.]|uniref:hypothetical protein n=1 Tax=Nocardioides sp. TaxID=35761 RepID=UPI002ED5306B